MQQQIRAVIEQVGSAGYLAPIKALLPQDFDYGIIRCVVEAWKIEQASVSTEIMRSAEITQLAPAAFNDLPFEPLRRWRHQRAAELNQPDWVLFGDGALRQLAQKRPRTIAELRSVSGLSTEVIERFGDELIAVINAGTSTETIDAILECVQALPGELPRSGVAKLLVGLWDNPRYRVTLISLEAALAAWAWLEVRHQESPWLRRMIVSVGILFAWFFPWYLQRYNWFEWPVEELFKTIRLGLASVYLFLILDIAREKEKTLRAKNASAQDAPQINKER